MTINLSSKGGSAGLGNATKDPRALPMTMAQQGQLYLKQDNNDSHNDGVSGFWTYLYDMGYRNVYNITDNGTYKTIIDLTDTSGKVFNIITPTHVNGGTGEIKVKLTIDGTEYILGPSVSTARRSMRFIIGGTYPFQPTIVDDQTYEGQLGSYDDKGVGAYYSINPYRVSYQQYIVDPLKYMMGGASFLYFENSFKYEVLLNSVYDTNYYNYGGLTYSINY